MTSQANNLLADAMQLTEGERGELAARLIESLGRPDDLEENSWDEEIPRRLEEISEGTVKLVPWTEARRMIADDVEELGES